MSRRFPKPKAPSKARSSFKSKPAPQLPLQTGAAPRMLPGDTPLLELFSPDNLLGAGGEGWGRQPTNQPLALVPCKDLEDSWEIHTHTRRPSAPLCVIPTYEDTQDLRRRKWEIQMTWPLIVGSKLSCLTFSPDSLSETRKVQHTTCHDLSSYTVI